MEAKKFLSKENLILLWGKLKSWVESKFSSFESKHFANSNVKVNVTVPEGAVFTDTNTEYSVGRGLHLKGTQIINTGVNSIEAGSSPGTLNVIRSDTNGQSYSTPVTIKGLKNRVILGYFKYSLSSSFDSTLEAWLNGANPDDQDSFTIISTGFGEVSKSNTVTSFTFQRPYKYPPNVFLTPYRFNVASSTLLTVGKISTTGFQMRSSSYNDDSWAEKFYWLAIGYGIAE